MKCDELESKDYNNGMTAYELMEENGLANTAKAVKKAIAELKGELADVLDDRKSNIELIDSLNEELAELREATRWRKCSEELPEKDKYVLAFCPNLKSIEIARILDDEWRDFSWNYLEVTHWMPLPKFEEK